MSIDTALHPADRSAAPRRTTRRRLWIAALVVVALAAGATAWLWRHPSQSFDGGYGLRLDGQVGESVWTSLTSPTTPGAEQVSIRGLEPHIVVDEAAVEIEYLICVLDPGVLERDGAFIMGGDSAHVDHYCASTRPAVGSTLRLRSEPREQLIVGITPTRPGRSVIRGHRLSFGVGWQVGADELEVETRIVTR